MVPSSLFILASSVCRSLQCLISALIKWVKVVTYLGSRVQLCSEGGTISLVFWGVLCVCPSSRKHVLSGSTLLRLQDDMQGNYPKWALNFVHFPGLSCSGSGSRVLHKGTDLVGHAFCVLPRSEQLR